MLAGFAPLPLLVYWCNAATVFGTNPCFLGRAPEAAPQQPSWLALRRRRRHRCSDARRCRVGTTPVVVRRRRRTAASPLNEPPLEMTASRRGSMEPEVTGVASLQRMAAGLGTNSAVRHPVRITAASPLMGKRLTIARSHASHRQNARFCTPRVSPAIGDRREDPRRIGTRPVWLRAAWPVLSGCSSAPRCRRRRNRDCSAPKAAASPARRKGRESSAFS